ncbi:uncharacterized protein SPPG_09465 [Spizellomyces punctatus DAOM BR117]|uniref:RPA-interacting protein C-terminal domain-containing protein n=1 Tax=Spizellomyces punctatus (strain DAOM BR117) TaxID=645134 RepID=A0A0L0H9W8_SPIPD|nr:uncharacterized protein SPPG_09465 [Spizellomyces punctatus DAOM BR117]KNC97453.1 hypothetical protein SPPG_09465 [Spizellomyces punctatus DAOM BR117]|eukprot:XP_016605493.1 hypothetical protein SPPG_09465 [Spizellomyces punctatus DAOM BR117]
MAHTQVSRRTQVKKPHSPCAFSTRPSVPGSAETQSLLNNPVWRDRFKLQCIARIKESRDAEVRRRRFAGHSGPSERRGEPQWRGEEIAPVGQVSTRSFAEGHCLEYHMEASIESRIPFEHEEGTIRELSTPATDEPSSSLWNDELVAAYNSSLVHGINPDEMMTESELPTGVAYVTSQAQCIVCQRASLILESNAITCPSCGLRIDCRPDTASIDNFIAHVRQLCINHEQTCAGHPLFTYDTETGLLILCSICDAYETVG